jgi:hypothetical protein
VRLFSLRDPTPGRIFSKARILTSRVVYRGRRLGRSVGSEMMYLYIEALLSSWVGKLLTADEHKQRTVWKSSSPEKYLPSNTPRTLAFQISRCRNRSRAYLRASTISKSRFHLDPSRCNPIYNSAEFDLVYVPLVKVAWQCPKVAKLNLRFYLSRWHCESVHRPLQTDRHFHR